MNQWTKDEDVLEHKDRLLLLIQYDTRSQLIENLTTSYKAEEEIICHASTAFLL